MPLREDLRAAIKAKRPKLSDSSLRTYSSLLVNLAKSVGADSIESLLSKKSEIIKEAQDKDSLQTKKTLLSALYVISGDQDYHDIMIETCNKVNKNYKEQKTSESRRNITVTPAIVQEVFKDVAKKLKSSPSTENYINYMIVALMSGALIPPRRNEWALLKIRNFDKETDNFYEKGSFTFNKYKTSSRFGPQVVKVPAVVLPHLKRWLKINTTDYLLMNSRTLKPFNSSELSKRIGQIFGDSAVGVDVLRSIYITDKYKDVPRLLELEETARQMGHSVNTAMQNYVKKD